MGQHPALDFAGGGRLESVETSLFSFQTSTAFIVLDDAARGTALSIAQAGTVNEEFLIFANQGPYGRSLFHHTSAGVFSYLPHTADIGASYVLSGSWSGDPNTLGFHVNGRPSDQDLVRQGNPVPYSQIPRAVYVGNRFRPREQLVGRIAEIIVYGRELSDVERAQTEAYLGAKYGIPIESEGGLLGEYYDGYFADDFGFFNGATPELTRIDSVIAFANDDAAWNLADVPELADLETFSTLWSGTINIPTTGEYTFYLSSDDASYLFLGDPARNPSRPTATIDNGGEHEERERSATLTLKAGTHDVLVVYGEARIDNSVYLSWSSADAGIPRQVVPPTVLSPSGGSETVGGLAVSLVAAPTTATAGETIGVRWRVTNEGPDPTTPARWYDRIYVSTAPAFDRENAVELASVQNLAALNSEGQPGDTYEATANVAIPRDAGGDLYVYVETGALTSLSDPDRTDNVLRAPSPIEVEVPPFPNLRVSSVGVPPTAFGGDTLTVQITVENVGDGPTEVAGWTDTILLSADDQLDFIFVPFDDEAIFVFDPVLGTARHDGVLQPGDAYTVSVDVVLPNEPGELFLIAYTDVEVVRRLNRTLALYRGGVYERNDEFDNWTPAPVSITLRPPPNLQVLAIDAPDVITPGQPFDLSWTVRNAGPGATEADRWTDAVYFSSDGALDDEDELLFLEIRDGSLDPGAEYSASGTAVAPPRYEGEGYLLVLTDALEEVAEFEGEDDNVGRRQPPLVAIPDPADLVPVSVSIAASGASGTLTDVAWTVTNGGTAPVAQEAWTDRVYVSPSTTFDPNEAVPVGREATVTALPVGGSYTATRSVRLPDGLAGDLYVYIVADDRDDVPEFDGEANNVRRSQSPITVELSPSPDLAVTAVGAPGAANAGLRVPVSWSAVNGGEADAQTVWSDTVYVSTSPTFDRASARPLAGVASPPALRVGETYSRSTFVTLPRDLPQGTYYFYAFVDADDAVYELPAGAENATRSESVEIGPYPPVNLALTALDAEDSVPAGDSLRVRWAARNDSEAPTPETGWADTVYLSADDTWDPGDTVLATVERVAPLPSGASYQRDVQVPIPYDISGTFYVFVVLGLASDGGPEGEPIVVAETLPADLVLTALDAPAGASNGDLLTLSWTVQNAGEGITPRDRWSDAVYLSSDGRINEGDFRLGTFSQTSPLATGDSYTGSLDARVPSLPPGTYQILIRLDNRDDIYEGEGEDNLYSTPLGLIRRPPADLVVTSISTPDVAEPGEEVEVSWQTQNAGPNPATGLIREVVYLSEDDVFDIDDPILGIVDREVDLAPDESVSARLLVNLARLFSQNGAVLEPVPGVLSGTYRILVRTDARDDVNEVDESNTFAAGDDTEVTLQDLAIGSQVELTRPNTYRRLRIAGASSVELAVESEGLCDARWFFSAGGIPTLSSADASGRLRCGDPRTANALIETSGQDGVLYLQADTLTTESDVFLSVLQPVLRVAALSADAIGRGGSAAIDVEGSGFVAGSSVQIESPGGARLPVFTDYRSPGHLSIQIDATTADLGAYDLVVINPDGNASAPVPLMVEPLQSPTIAHSIDLPSVLRRGDTVSLTYVVRNEGNVTADYVMAEVVFMANEGEVEANLPQGAFGAGTLWFAEEDEPYESFYTWNTPEGTFHAVPMLFRDIGPMQEAQARLEFTPAIAGPITLTSMVRARSRGESCDLIRIDVPRVRAELLDRSGPGLPSSVLASDDALFEYIVGHMAAVGIADLEFLQSCPAPSKQDLARASREERGHALSSSLLPVLPQNSIQLNGANCTASNLTAAVCNYIDQMTCDPPAFRSPTGIPTPNMPIAVNPTSWGLGMYYGGMTGDTCNKTNRRCQDAIDPSCGDSRGAFDPNDIIGPAAYGDENWVQRAPLTYTIRFENDPDLATAPARDVVIEQFPDSDLDLATFRLASFGFASLRFPVPENRSFYSDRLATTDSLGVDVDVSAGVDVVRDRLFWSFRSVDPATGLPPTGPLDGFLPVNDDSGRGEGFVSYTIRPSSEAPNGARIDAQAEIVFDTNEPIVTPAIFNTLDSQPPVSALSATPSGESPLIVELTYEGSDGDTGSGLATYDLFVSRDGGPFEPFAVQITDPSVLFNREPGREYAFRVQAFDNVGNAEPASTSPDIVLPVSTEDDSAPVTTFALGRSYPNPTSGSATIPFALAAPSEVTVEVFDILGRRVAVLREAEEMPAGRHSLHLDLRGMASGTYLYRLQAGSFTSTMRLALIR